MTEYETLLAAADIEIDDLMGEAFAFTPMREVVNGEPEPDPDRDPIASVVGVFDEVAADMTVGDTATPERVTAGPKLSVRDVLLTEGVQRFDRFTRATNGIVYEVSDAKPDGVGRTAIDLVELVENT